MRDPKTQPVEIKPGQIWRYKDKWRDTDGTVRRFREPEHVTEMRLDAEDEMERSRR